MISSTVLRRAFCTSVAAITLAHTPVAAASDELKNVAVQSAERLHEIFRNPVTSIHVQLAAGEYELESSPYTDPTCGNCQPDAIDTRSETTIGLHIRGSNIHLSGPDEGEAIIRTNAGYGILIEDAENIVLQRITITGGDRSKDSNATDGAIVVRRADLTLRHCTIRDNIGDEDVVRQTVSGVMGVVGREQSRITIDHCRILRNSWDGIALYRGAQATITNTIVDGMERSTGAKIGGGRGVGIGVTWDARATVRDTLIRRYWKGLGIFVDAQVDAEHVIVEEIITWGIALWGAGGGQPCGHLRNNIIFNTGACGVSLAASTSHDDPGELIGNIIARAGQDAAYDAPDRYCRQCPIARARVPEGFREHNNVLYDNRRADCGEPDADLSEEEDFRERIADLVDELTQRPALQDAGFLRKFRNAGLPR
jgi:hypothetical protein